MDVTHITCDYKCRNTCFLNASLQALLANVELRNRILELDHSYQNCQGEAYNKDGKVCILCHFVEVANNANIQQQHEKHEVSSTSIYHALKEVHDGFTPGDQHDAHEFIVKFLEKMQGEVENQTGVLEELFGMKCVNKVVCCQCRAETTHEPEMHSPCILVEFKENLKESIRCFFKEEKIEDKHCDRFRFNSLKSVCEKITEQAMSVPEVIDSEDFINNHKNICYKLYCFIVHIGSMPSNGHYVAYRKSGQKWYRCDDAKLPETVDVNSRNELELQKNETAYLLFYEMCDRSLLDYKVAVSVKEVLELEDAKNANCNEVEGAASPVNTNTDNAVNGVTDEDILRAVDEMSLNQQPDDLLAMNGFVSVIDAPSQPNGIGKRSEKNAMSPNAALHPSYVGGESLGSAEPQNFSLQLNGTGDGSEGNYKPPNATPRTTGIQDGSQGYDESHDSPFQPKADVAGSDGNCVQKENREVTSNADSQDSSEPPERKLISGDQVLRQFFETLTREPEPALPRDAEGRFGQINRNRVPEESSNNSLPPYDHRPIPSSGEPGSNGTPALVSPEITIKLRPKIESAVKVKQWTDFFIQKYTACPESLEHALKVSVLPVGTCLSSVLPGSLKLAIQVTSSKALEELWEKYECGVLKASMERVFATEDVKKLVNCQEIELDLDIKKEEYKSGLEMLIKLEMQDVPLKSVVNNPALMDELGGCLDRPYHVMKYWRHLAYELKVPPIISRQFELYSAHSPSIKLFEYLQVEKPELTIKDLKDAFGMLYRNDLVKIVNEAKLRANDKVCGAVTDNTHLLERISRELDTGVKPVGNWKSLAGRLRIPMSRIYQFEMYSSQNPTAQLFRYLAKFQRNLTVGILKKHLKTLSRNDVLLQMEAFRLEDDDLVKRVIDPDSNLSITMEELLNKEIAGFGKSWRKLANKLNVPHDEYDRWEEASGKARHSPTKQLLEWLRSARENLSLTELANTLHKMDRNDAVVILTRYIPSIARRAQEQPPSAQPASYGDEVTDGPVDQRRMQPGPSNQLATADTRQSTNISKIPLEIYSKVCRKLDIKRELFYDDFRMLGEKIGLERDLIEYVGQKSSPTNEILKKWSARVGAKATVGKLIEILHTMERADAAEVLEVWVGLQTH